MRGYIVDETYRIEGGKAFVYLFGRLENSESFLAINRFEPYFCIKEEDVAKAEKTSTGIRFRIERTKLSTMQDEPVVKILLDIPRDVPELRKAFENKKIICYEADIRFTQRFLLDHNILRSVDIEGDFEKNDFVSRVYREPKLAPSDWQPRLRVLSLDIETSMDGKDLYCVSLACRDENHEAEEVLIVHHGKEHLKKATSFPDEKSLLERFRRRVVEIDPDIITGWSLIDFDLAVLKRKFEQHKIPFRMARQDWDCTLRIESSFMKDSKAEFPGRQVLDGIHLLKMNFIKLDDYKLGTAASELLGEKKLIGDENKGKEIEDAYRKHPQRLVDYNLKDSQLVLDVLGKTDAVGLTVSRTLLTGMSLERVRGSIASFDSLYLRDLRAKDHVAPSSQYSEKDEPISGGYVMESKPGIYDNIIVLDFKSLYPSIIRTFNIDPLAYERGKLAKDPKRHKDKWIIAPNEGILPSIIQRLWGARDVAKKRKDDLASFAIKVHMNSFFGVLANPTCRFFSMEMANAITGFGRHLIQLTMQKIAEMGYTVIYGDTDSVFVDAKAKSYTQSSEIAKGIEREINVFYEKHIRDEYRRECFMELEVDKIFVHFIMPRVRGSEEGAKKRYAGMVLNEKGKEELDVTGLEIVRRDWTDLAKGFQQRMLELVFSKEDPTDFVKRFMDDLRAGKLDGQLVYRKAIRKELDGYTKTTPPHVKAARKLEDAGVPLTSTLIEYVMTEDGPEPLQLLRKRKKKAIDYDHYIEKQLRPIADAILCFYDVTLDDILKGHSQKTLFGY
jgi:DNA polymerase-2